MKEFELGIRDCDDGRSEDLNFSFVTLARDDP